MRRRRDQSSAGAAPLELGRVTPEGVPPPIFSPLTPATVRYQRGYAWSIRKMRSHVVDDVDSGDCASHQAVDGQRGEQQRQVDDRVAEETHGAPGLRAPERKRQVKKDRSESRGAD